MIALLARVLLLAACATAVLTAPEPSRTTRNLSDNLYPVDVVTKPVALRDIVPLTNAQRLARGLPPNPPRRRSRTARALQPRQSSTCVAQTGTIAVSTGGYLSATATSYGEYSSTTDVSQALLVSFCVDTTVGTTFDLQTLNGLSAYPYLGAVQGFADRSRDLAAGSFNYYYIAGTEQTARGPAVPGVNSFSAAAGVAEAVESNIWTLTDTNELVPSFVNSDGTAVTPSIVYVSSSNAFAITSDVGAFTSNFGAAQPVTFTFVPATAATVPV
ncbi:hypothetical protein DICSQDRAFT_146821 [Dichomitus squalens LYAD-421 SS1]|uniref:Uncharacterized protein n=1 Tax=Dichomitus squalens (strain LYAD-421) TaxID=732165 RepID=R7T259_DICSQ|nr:uncharacterized protein DICSQDRAFT_146821 [Dichomitus squalens LYAD-421 SS1]EJF62080.1 hypothetical protein DICSQDRAFT_146821 [Dichomitus squalens LYAD-421 SS1]